MLGFPASLTLIQLSTIQPYLHPALTPHTNLAQVCIGRSLPFLQDLLIPLLSQSLLWFSLPTLLLGEAIFPFSELLKYFSFPPENTESFSALFFEDLHAYLTHPPLKLLSIHTWAESMTKSLLHPQPLAECLGPSSCSTNICGIKHLLAPQSVFYFRKLNQLFS